MHAPADDDPIVRFLARKARPVARGESPCPDGKVLGGFVERRLSGPAADAVIEHLAGCDDCRAVVGALSGEGAAGDAGGEGGARGEGRGGGSGGALVQPAAAPSAPQWRWMRPALAAAGIVLAVVLVWQLGWGSKNGERAEGLERRLVAAADDLRGKAPGSLAGFRPYGIDELNGLGREVLRGAGVQPISPAKRMLETRPQFRFDAPRSTAGWDLVLTAAADGRTVWKTPVPALDAAGPRVVPYPAGEKDLDPGAGYVWEIAGEVCRFEVASDADRQAFDANLRLVDASVDPALRSLVKAHVALRADLLGAAEQYAREAHAAHPGDPFARATLLSVLRLLRADTGGI
jgi:Putative zinc-finger